MVEFKDNQDGTTTINNFPSDSKIECLIDTEDVAIVLKCSKSWYYHKQRGYVFTNKRNKVTNDKTITKGIHSVIMDTPEGFDTDHINGNKLDNRKINLRIVSHEENMQNMYKHRDEEWLAKQEAKLAKKKPVKNIYPYTNKRLKKTYLVVKYHGLTKYCNTLEEAEHFLQEFKNLVANQKSQTQKD